MSIEDFDRELKELAQRFWDEEINLSQELRKIRLRYPKSIRKEYSEKHPVDKCISELFSKILCDPTPVKPVFMGSLTDILTKGE